MSYYCPSCGSKLEFVVRPKFCPECGESTAPGFKKPAVAAPVRPSAANFRRPVHGYNNHNQYEGEIQEVPELDGLSFSYDDESVGRKFTIQDVMSNRVSTAGKRDTSDLSKEQISQALVDIDRDIKRSSRNEVND